MASSSGCRPPVSVVGAETHPALDSRGEILIGAIGPHNPAPNPNVVNDVHIFSPLTGDELQRIAAPDQQGGAAFGISLAPIGDVNGDGFADFAAGAGFYRLTAPGACVSTCTNAGRVYIFRSDNSPPAAVVPPPPPPPPPPGPAGATGQPGPAGTAAAPRVLAGRTLELAVSSNSIRRSSTVTLRGAVEAFANRSSCERNQTVALQRRSRRSTQYRTFARVRTNAAGRFSRRSKPTATFVYRLRVSQTSQCLGASSNRETIVVTRRSAR